MSNNYCCALQHKAHITSLKVFASSVGSKSYKVPEIRQTSVFISAAKAASLRAISVSCRHHSQRGRERESSALRNPEVARERVLKLRKAEVARD